MCAVSAVLDWAHQQPITVWTQPRFDEFSEIVRRLDALDKLLNQPDCDPAKADIMKTIQDRLKHLEELALKRQGVTVSGT